MMGLAKCWEPKCENEGILWQTNEWPENTQTWRCKECAVKLFKEHHGIKE